MQKTCAGLLLIGSILAAFGGVAAFIFLFVRDINVYILILSPIILACYQIPAAVLYGLYKRARQSEQEPEDTDGSSPKKQVLFVCTHNSVRSQMAEGLMNSLYGDRYEARSAGTEPAEVNPRAVSVLLELGIDISPPIEACQRIPEPRVRLCDNGLRPCPRDLPGLPRGERDHPSQLCRSVLNTGQGAGDVGHLQAYSRRDQGLDRERVRLSRGLALPTGFEPVSPT